MISVQKFSTLGIKPDKETRRSTRAYIDTGKLCNYDCEFCYYKDQLDQRDTLKQVLDRIDYAADYGCDSIDMCGGEPSVEPNFFKYLTHATKRGLKGISCITNGSRFCNMEFLKKSKELGLSEILFSLHGYDKESHERITKRKGSFEKIIKAIHNAHELGMTVRINCTVYDVNAPGLVDKYPELIKTLNPLEVNFIALKYDSDNSDFRKVDYSEVIDNIKIAIDKLKDSVKYINIRFTPFCYAQGYEKHVVNHYQHVYDIFDWNRATYNQGYPIKNYTEDEYLKNDYEMAAWFRIEGFHKEESCRKCKYFYICDGIDKQLKGQELVPIEGDKINDPNHFRKGFYDINDSYLNPQKT